MNRAPKLQWILLALICSAGILQASLPPTTIGAWTAAANLSQARTNAASVLLADGRILITGGDGGSGALNSAELFTPNGTVAAAANMNVSRSGHFAVELSDGRVLVGGGISSGGGATNSAEIYDPTADSWTQIGPMTAARANASAALLQDGRVLIAGGDNSGVPSNTIEIFDASTGNFSFAGTLSSPRTKQAMAVLQDGRVLIVGGFDGTNALASSDIVDPSTGTVSAGPALATPRYSESATTLLNGQVVVIGGATTGNSGTVDVASAEIFDPATGVFGNAGVSLTTAREGHQAFLLPSNNSVLVVGGVSGGQVVAASELFVPQVSIADGSWSYAFAPTASNVTPRAVAVGSAMNVDGLLLVAGGKDPSGNALASTELYAFPVVKTDATDYSPGSTVTISGSGFRPGEIVNITIVESPLIDTPGPFTATADGNGNFTNSSFTTDINDVNVRFWLTAVGSQSGLVAENTFTDGNASSVSGTVKSSATGNPAIVGATVICTSGCNNSPAASTTSGTGGAYVFDGKAGDGPKLSFGGNGPVTLQLTASATGFTSSTISLSNVNNGNTITNANFTLTPSAIATTTTVSSSANPSVFGQPVSFTATVTPASGSTVPTGTIQFVVDGSNFGAPVTLSACSPSPNACATSGSTSTLTVNGSSHSVTANYTATGSFTGGSGSLSGGQTVNKANTSSTVVSSLNPSPYGQSVTFTATVAAVSPGAGAPTGTVDFKDGAATLASGVAVSGGQASFSTSALNAATHSITAVYSGDGNFNASGTGGSTATALSQVVNPATLTASITGNPTKPYDGNTSATLTAANFLLSGLVGSDSFTITQTAGTYNSKDVAAANSVTASLTPANFIPLGSTSANNYNLPTTASGAGHITAVSLSASVTGNPTKPYDGTTNAILTPANFSLSGLVGTEAFTVTKTAGSYNSKDVLSATTITVSMAPSDFTAGGGALASNYTLPVSASGPGQITAVNVTASIVGTPSKPYDGTTAASLTSANFQLAGVVAGESITVNQTVGSYNSKDVLSASTVSANLSTGNFTAGPGTLLTNYVLPASASGAGQITPKTVTASIVGTPTKVYDGNNTATLAPANFSLSGVVSGESFSVTQTSGSYSSKDVAVADTVTATLAAADFAAGAGTAASNYSLPNSASGAGLITPKGLTAAIVGTPTKTYDGTAAATLTAANFQISGLVGTESFTVTQTVGAYDTKNVTATTVSAGLPSGDFTPANGTLASNYTLPTTASGPGQITRRPLTVTASGVNKVYDGTTAASVVLSDDKVSGDAVNDNYTSASFADKNVGTAKVVSVSGISVSGTDAGNYALQNTTTNTTADITSRPITITATGVNKVYDGNTNATVTLADDRVVGDVLTDSYSTASFDSKNVGTSKPVSVSNISISGTDAGNYSLQNTTANTVADITQRPLAITATGVNKVYDGTAGATVTLNDDRVTGDAFTDSYTSASFTDKNVGTGKTVNVSGISIAGVDAGNYSFNTSTTATADITTRPLTVGATGINRAYDGTTNAAVTLSDNRVSGDVLADNYTSAAFPDKNVGSGKPVTVSGISISGTDAGNYSLQNTTAAATADITTRPLTVTATGVSKVYDGTATATVTLADNRVAGDSITDAYTGAVFPDKNVGNGKTVSVSGISISGPDAGNYQLGNTTATTTANITPLHITGSFTAANKVYDGTTSATVLTRSLVGTLNGDNTSLSGGTATFSDKNAGVNKTVTLTGAILTGTDAGNYALDSVASATATITPAPLTITAATNTKTYDGTTSASAVPTLSGVQPGDTVTGLSETYDTANAGTNKVLSVSSYTINDGSNGANYAVSLVSNNTGVITAAPTATVLVAAPNPATLGQAVTFNATVSNTAATPPVPTGAVQFVIDGTNYGSPVPLAAGAASISTSSLSAGQHIIKANYINSDGNFSNSNANLMGNETVNFGFLGLFAPYQPPSAGVAYKINSAIPIKWQYTDNGGSVVNSSNANPQVYISGPYACGGTDSVAEVLALSSGASGYQYDPTTNSWQFNWKTTGLNSGCYNINIKSVLTGQTTGPFPIQLR